MKILKYFTLIFILLNVPTFGVKTFGSTIGGLLSVLLFACIILYYFLNKKQKLPIPFLLIGLTYFLIAGINYSGIINDYLIDAIKYFIFIISIVHLAKNTTQKELVVLMSIGAISVLINAIFFSTHYGRYGGFYINPNKAGFACLIAFSLSFLIKSKILKLTLQLLIVTAGIMTLSRSFIILLILVNIIALVADRKNSISLLAGTFAIVIVLTVSSIFQLNTSRFSAFQSIFSSEEIETKTITQGSREETWALYTDMILDNVVIGSGYNTLHGNKGNYAADIRNSVHNTYLMALGEAGIIPFLLFIIVYISLFVKSLKYYKSNPEYLCIATILLTFLLVSHNYFDNYLVLFISIWLYEKVKLKKDENLLIDIEKPIVKH